jgi:hypothetical protein
VVMNLWSLIMKYYGRLEELDGDRLLCKAYEQSKYLASCGMCSWYHYMAQGWRQFSNRFEFKSTSRLTDSLRSFISNSGPQIYKKEVLRQLPIMK